MIYELTWESNESSQLVHKNPGPKDTIKSCKKQNIWPKKFISDTKVGQIMDYPISCPVYRNMHGSTDQSDWFIGCLR